MNLGKCESCSRTVYDTEAVKIGSGSQHILHSKCFKCQNPGCSWKLNYSNYTYYEGKAYCQNHNPMKGLSNNTVAAKGIIRSTSMEVSAALTSPRVHVERGVFKGADNKE
eukprot:TRINITY_DN3495_c0_g1_i1.p1 TRINITY_DN3495_c0_g1~~TRINITY_DN3495_c0_g1_i1.p1  ORF type:complete len:110 (-),score=16.15 TRINITY_DN3495_c0_g1_i1:88-417(-)